MSKKRIRQGRFPANLLVSDDVLNDGKTYKSTGGERDLTESVYPNSVYGYNSDRRYKSGFHPKDEGSYSRYFDLDKWYNEMTKED